MFKSKTLLALQVLSVVHAATDSGERITVGRIAEKTERSTPSIEQIVSVLRANQLVQGHLGPSGGYTLEGGNPRGYEYERITLWAFDQMFYPDGVLAEYITTMVPLIELHAVVIRPT